MKYPLLLSCVLLSGICLAQAPLQPAAAKSMEVRHYGGALVTSTPTAKVSFHPLGIDLQIENGDEYAFRFNHNRVGNKPEIRQVEGAVEIWYPRLYKDISLRCYVKEDGEIGYDWRMGPGADARDVHLTVDKKVAAKTSSVMMTEMFAFSAP